MIPGRVYIVGAGPGPADLLTVKAARLLGLADVVIHDRLIQEEVLALARPGAELIYMGKTVGSHASRQQEIHELLESRSREGRQVVRLKGGDPFLLGRGGEEAEFLAREGIPFEVVPGVSSALAAPLRAGIAVTHRDLASSVTIVTGHEAAGDSRPTDWEALARVETLVYLMGVHNLRNICERLIAHGRAPATPAAVIQKAYWQDELVVEGTLADIAGRAESEGITPPATLVIGEVVRLREKMRPGRRQGSKVCEAQDQ